MENFKISFICLCLYFMSNCVASDGLYKHFQQFKVQYKRIYASDLEEQKRFQVYLKNVAFINAHNLNYSRSLTTFTLKANEYTDWSPQEFSDFMNGYNEEEEDPNAVQIILKQGETFKMPTNIEIPEAVDWRAVGAVTRVKKQKRCGSCWAFSSTGALESLNYLKTLQLITLSEQNLIDCCGNNGCSGGIKERAFLYVRDNGGLDTGQSYPYQAVQNDQCLFNASTIGATCYGFVNIPPMDEMAMTAAVATVGPITISINAKCLKLQFYEGGIFNDSECDDTRVNHGLLIVGYGKDNVTQTDYWILKNSWGPKWGENGYLNVPRFVNYAGLSTRASYPIV